MTEAKLFGYIRDCLFLLLLIYNLQGTIYEQGSIVSQASLALMMGISLIFFFKTLFQKEKKNKFYKIWTLLMFLNTIGYLFFTPELKGLYFSHFKVTLFNLILFYPFFYFAQNELLSKKHLSRFFVLYLPVAIGLYFFNMSAIMETYNRSEELVVNNIAYYFVNLMPFVFLFKRKRILSIGTMFLLMYFIIQGSKRGAILVGGMGLVFFMYYQLRTLRGRIKILGVIGSLVAMVGLGYYAYTTLLRNEFVLERLGRARDGSFSGREVIFKNIWETWLNSGDYIHYLFGYGFAASVRLSEIGGYAHSDWLEMLSNFGLLGALLYLLIFWTGIRMTMIKDWKIEKKILLFAVLGIWFLTSIASMALYSTSGFLLVILLSYLMGSKSKSLA